MSEEDAVVELWKHMRTQLARHCDSVRARTNEELLGASTSIDESPRWRQEPFELEMVVTHAILFGRDPVASTDAKVPETSPRDGNRSPNRRAKTKDDKSLRKRRGGPSKGRKETRRHHP